MPTPPFPTRTDGSFGQAKADLEAPTDLQHQLQASEYNNVANWLISIIAEIGNPDGSTANSIWKAIDDIVVGTGGDVDGPAGGTADGMIAIYDDTTGKLLRAPNPAVTEAAVLANNAKVSNANHSGHVAGSTALTIQPGVVTNSMHANAAAYSVKANPGGIQTQPQDLALGTNTVLGRQGSNIVAAQLATGQIANNAVTYAKMQEVSASARVLGRAVLAGAGVPTEINQTQLTAMLQPFATQSTVQGAVPGSAGAGIGHFLRADRAWAIPAAGTEWISRIGTWVASTTSNVTEFDPNSTNLSTTTSIVINEVDVDALQANIFLEQLQVGDVLEIQRTGTTLVSPARFTVNAVDYGSGKYTVTVTHVSGGPTSWGTGLNWVFTAHRVGSDSGAIDRITVVSSVSSGDPLSTGFAQVPGLSITGLDGTYLVQVSLSVALSSAPGTWQFVFVGPTVVGTEGAATITQPAFLIDSTTYYPIATFRQHATFSCIVQPVGVQTIEVLSNRSSGSATAIAWEREMICTPIQL